VDENIDGVEIPSSSGGDFIKSKWEELDPEQVSHQAITTSKWELLNEPVVPEPPKISICNYGDSSDSEEGNQDSNDDFKRKKLRDIEVKILEYQDELESGNRQLKSGWSIKQQVEHFRRKLLKKAEKNDSDSQSSSSRQMEISERKLKRRSDSSDRERDHRSKSSSKSR
jgi:U2-associated protein SR140